MLSGVTKSFQMYGEHLCGRVEKCVDVEEKRKQTQEKEGS